MKILNKLILTILILLSVSCSNNEKVSIVTEKNIETQMIEAFEEGYKELENGDVLFAYVPVIVRAEGLSIITLIVGVVTDSSPLTAVIDVLAEKDIVGAASSSCIFRVCAEV